ncbi:MAG: serine hydrolase domain-containing protein [Promethearchaeota archaeon]|jgi:CubicO group peptidase (beta-lactamase class C family)
MKKNKKIILGIAIIGIVAATSTGIALVGNFTQAESAIDTRIQQLMSEGDVPSMSVGIIINDTLVWSKGYGDLPDLNTVYMIGSVTKMFTATAIMQLYENNTLDLDANINNYIPFNVSHPLYPALNITIRQLLSHSSGISHADKPLWDFEDVMLEWFNTNLGSNYAPCDPRPTLGEFLNGSLNPAGPYYKSENWQNFEPGTDWQYSNLGFLLLSYIVEQLSNQSYIDYLQKNVLNPLDMNSTGFYYQNFTERNAYPHELKDEETFKGPLFNSNDIGGGALRSTVPDLANFLIMHMNQGNYKSSQILQPQTVDLMQTAQFSMFGNNWGGFTFIGYGLGWPIYADNYIGHSGATVGYIAHMSFKTVSTGKYGIVFMLNKGSSLAEDAQLVNTFFPSMIDTLYEEAVRLYNM